jgi:Bacterial tandem repeat domain 1
MLYLNWRGSGADQALYEAGFSGPGPGVPFDVAVPIPGRGSVTGPAVVTFAGQRVMAWRGIQGDADSDQTLYYAFNDGSGWTAQVPLTDRGSAVGPSIAMFRGELHMAWRGISDDQGLWWSRYPHTGRNAPWSDPLLLTDRASSRGPSLAAYGGLLFMAWRGVIGDEHLYWSTFDGNSWSPQHPIVGPVSGDAPWLVPFGPDLFLMWRGGNFLDESDLVIYYSKYLGGMNWSPQTPLVNDARHAIGTESRAGIAAFNNTLFIASVGNATSAPQGGGGGGDNPPPVGSDPRIFIETFDGSTAVGHVLTPQQTDYQPALSSFGEDRYAGIWEQRDGSAFAAAHNIGSDEYQRRFDTLLAQGYRLVHINAHSLDGSDRYAAIWERSDGPAWQARHRLTAAQHQQAFDQLIGQGYRPIRVSGYAISDVDHYASIWELRDGPALQARHALTAQQYQQTFDDLLAQGFRLVDVSGYCVAGQDLYTGIWELSDGRTWQARHLLTTDQFQQAFDDLLAQGYRLVHINGYNLNGQDRYAGIWEHTNGPAFQARHGETAAEYQQSFDDLLGKGYRLTRVSGF